jgi:YidC/Oxa1 family membrane protein insertase
MNLPGLSCALLWLQSNSLVSQAVQGITTIPQHYKDHPGVTDVIAAFFLNLIIVLASFVHDYGLAIMLSAVLLRIMLLPLTRQQIQGMKAMQMLQPVMKAIQAYYPDKNDQSAKTMELYQKFKINPLAGCLPMFIQLPILFGVYRALYDPSFSGKSFLGIQLLFPVNVTSARNLGVGADLRDVIDVTVAQQHMQHLLWHVPDRLPLIGGAYLYWPALALVVLYVASNQLMQWKMRKVNAPNKDFEQAFLAEMKLKDPPSDPSQDFANQMQRQMGVMNLMIVIMAFIFSAGALLYYIIQNCLMFLEYTFLPRGMQLALDPKELRAFIKSAPPRPGAPVEANSRPSSEGSPKTAADNGKLDIRALAGSAAIPSEEDGDDEPDGSASSGSLKPRPRKRRKR